MNTQQLEKFVYDAAKPIVEAKGLGIWGLELVDGPRLVIRLYVDIPLEVEKTGDHVSATLDQCEDISRQLELAIDVEAGLERPWTLEVSSPGLERIFFDLAQMRPYIGDLVDVRLAAPLDGFPERKNWRGELVDAGDDYFIIKPCNVTEEGNIIPEDIPPCRIPWQNTRRARRLHVFKMPQKPGGKRKRK